MELDFLDVDQVRYKGDDGECDDCKRDSSPAYRCDLRNAVRSC